MWSSNQVRGRIQLCEIRPLSVSVAMEDSVPLSPASPVSISAPPTYYSPTPQPAQVQAVSQNPIGVYGWRKRCLYLAILLLVVVMLVNLGLTAWILVVLDFNTRGMGNLEISQSGIRLEGPAEFLGPLHAQSISTDQGSPLNLLSEEAINMRVANGSSLQLTNSSLNIAADQLQVSKQDGSTPLLSVSNRGVNIGPRLEVVDPLGATLQGPLEANQVQSPANQNLQIQSLSGELQLTGGRSVRIEDGVGFDGVQVTSHSNLVVSSQTGQVLLSGQSISLQGLPQAGQSDSGMYEVCVCAATGNTLYLVPASTSCNQDNGICTP